MEITIDEMKIMVHSLGNKNPKLWHRNFFGAHESHHDFESLKSLESKHLMERQRTPSFLDPDEIIFSVTDKGKDEVKSFFNQFNL